MRDCLLRPLPEIFQAAALMQSGVFFHLNDQNTIAETCFKAADSDAIREWTEALWGRRTLQVHGNIEISSEAPIL